MSCPHDGHRALILTRRASEGSEALPSLALRVSVMRVRNPIVNRSSLTDALGFLPSGQRVAAPIFAAPRPSPEHWERWIRRSKVLRCRRTEAVWDRLNRRSSILTMHIRSVRDPGMDHLALDGQDRHPGHHMALRAAAPGDRRHRGGAGDSWQCCGPTAPANRPDCRRG
jgi:hypothetical protein